MVETVGCSLAEGLNQISFTENGNTKGYESTTNLNINLNAGLDGSPER